MNKIIKLLYEIKERPGMYLGKKSLVYLFMYLSGYFHRECEIQIDYKGLLPGFQDFVQERYKTNASASWASIISGNETTEEEAFDKFYELLDEFVSKQSGKIIME